MDNVDDIRKIELCFEEAEEVLKVAKRIIEETKDKDINIYAKVEYIYGGNSNEFDINGFDFSEFEEYFNETFSQTKDKNICLLTICHKDCQFYLEEIKNEHATANEVYIEKFGELDNDKPEGLLIMTVEIHCKNNTYGVWRREYDVEEYEEAFNELEKDIKRNVPQDI